MYLYRHIIEYGEISMVIISALVREPTAHIFHHLLMASAHPYINITTLTTKWIRIIQSRSLTFKNTT